MIQKRVTYKKVVLLFGLLFTLNSNIGFSKSYNLEKIIVNTKEQSDSKLDSSLSVGVVSKDRITEDMPVTITEILDDIPGVSLTSPAGALFQNPVVRGLGGKRIVMLQDGHLLTSEKSIGVTGYYLEMTDVERMEVTKGPGSVLYGSGALSGIVSIYTQDPILLDGFRSLYSFKYDDKGQQKVNVLSTGYGNEKFGVKVIGRDRNADNYKTASGEEVINSRYGDDSLTVKLAYKPTENQKIKLYTMQYRGEDIGKARTPEDDDGFQLKRVLFPYDRHHLYNGSYEVKKLGMIDKLSAYVQYRKSEQLQQINQYTNIDLSTPDYYTEKVSDNKSITGRILADFNIGQYSLVTLGVDHVYKKLNMTEDKYDWLTNPMTPGVKTLIKVSATVPYDDATYRSIGLFGSTEHIINDSNIISTGIRFDSVTTNYPYGDGTEVSANNKAVSGNLGYLYTLGKEFNFTLNMGRAFRAPGIKEKFVDQRTCKGLFFGNADLEPETSINFDIGVKGELERTNYEFYLFSNYVRDFVGVVPHQGQVKPHGYWDYGYKYLNISKVRLLGGEFTLSHHIPLNRQGLWLKLSDQFSYVNGRDISRQQDLAQIPPYENKMKARLYKSNVLKMKKMFLEGAVRYIGKKNNIHSSDLSFTPVTDKATPSVITYSLGMGLKSKKILNRYSIDLFMRIENITNKSYRYFLDPIESSGRNYKFGITINL